MKCAYKKVVSAPANTCKSSEGSAQKQNNSPSKQSPKKVSPKKSSPEDSKESTGDTKDDSAEESSNSDDELAEDSERDDISDEKIQTGGNSQSA